MLRGYGMEYCWHLAEKVSALPEKYLLQGMTDILRLRGSLEKASVLRAHIKVHNSNCFAPCKNSCGPEPNYLWQYETIKDVFSE